MGKRRIFTIAFWILTVLLFCTTVSFKIQDLMKNEVIIEISEKSKDGMTETISASAVVESVNGTGVYRIKTREGILRQESRALFNGTIPVAYEGEKAVFSAGSDLRDVIVASVYPVEEGMLVEQVYEILPQEEAAEEAKGQKKNLMILAASVLMGFVLAFLAERCIRGVFDRKYVRCIVGVCLILGAVMLLYLSMERVEIPRAALPEECIFDLTFYRQIFIIN